MTDDDTPCPWDETVMVHAVPPLAPSTHRRRARRRLREIEDHDDVAMWAEPPGGWEP